MDFNFDKLTTVGSSLDIMMVVGSSERVERLHCEKDTFYISVFQAVVVKV